MLKLRGKHTSTRNNTIAIFSLPRSGSTWFSELLNEIPKTIKVDEPLYRGPLSFDGNMPARMGKLKDLDSLNFYYFQPIPKNAHFPDAEIFFEDLFSLKFSNPYLFEETRFLQIPRSQNALFKFCYGNLLLPWLVERYDFTPIVLLRNPYAVVSSQMKHEAFEETLNQNSFKLPELRYKEFFDQYDEVLKTVKYPEEILTAIWCINYLSVINSQEAKQKWLVVSYEHLLMNPKKELTRIFNYLERPLPKKVIDRFTKPSRSTEKSTLDWENQLTNWKSELNADQIARIKRILLKFDIHTYSESPLPDEVIYN